MDKIDIQEGNKLIAEFMGGQYTDYPNNVFAGQKGYHFPLRIDNSDWWNQNALKFDRSWDWLMEVVEKIEALDLGVSVVIKENKCGIYRHKGSPYEYLIEKITTENKIASTYLAVIAFIKWFNQTKG